MDRKRWRARVLRASAIAALALWASASFAAKTVYVNAARPNDLGSGLTWATAKKTVTAGLGLAVSGDQVWVAKGAYLECITLKAGAALYGGFAGTETSLGQRPAFPRQSFDPNISLLDGNLLGSVVTAPSEAATTTVIDGFTIRGGIGTLSGSVRRGGGIYCQGSSPTIANNTIVCNTADEGGGIYCGSCSPSVKNNEISENSGWDLGGGICLYASSAQVANNFIADNRAFSGGGISCTDSSADLISNAIVGNAASQDGGGICCQGTGAPRVTNNTVFMNTALVGGGISFASSSSANVRNTLLSGNTAGQGGCAWRDGTSAPTLSRCCFWDNGTQPFYPTSWNPVGSNGCIQADPLFLAPWVRECHLRSVSPCLDAGDDTAVQTGWTDLDGKQRKLNTHVDIGCFEWDSTAYWVRTVSQARAVPYEFNVELRRKSITAAFTGAFYIEDSSRAGGIRVLSSQTVTPGDWATVAGPLKQGQDAELSIQASSVSTQTGSAASIPSALGMRNRRVGGGDYFFSIYPEYRGQPGLVYSAGLNNIGLLVRTWGRVTARGPAGWFYVDDGSRVEDGTGQIGVYVEVPSTVTPPVYGAYVGVSGISGCGTSVNDDVTGILRVRGTDDITPFP